ncbi:MAG: ABC transporter ATP-binding protein [Nitrospirae bacterium]|nr:MAG: ABC transporter ATP-binding protein [Nitrospirota bacterium]
MIDVKDISKRYYVGGDEIVAVDNVSLNIKKGEFVSILGHSGSGKTTLLSLIGGLTRPDTGTVLIDDTDIWALGDDELSEFRNRKLNFIYQFSSLISTLTILENVLLPTTFGKDYSEEKVDFAIELLEMMGIKDKANSYPAHLSGGQQRRAAIARAFINNPDIILADEPTGDLDEETEAEVMELFKRMNREKDITFIMVTHSSELARQTERVFRMSKGRLKEE